jgi:hypothetical protein
MKTVLTYLILSILIFGCSESRNELFKETDTFVESLYSNYESYGLLGGKEHSKTTSDALYTIMPLGRLINVKIEKAVGADQYEDLRKDLETHYSNDKRVKKVYINNAGTIMIDCRN